MCKEPSEYVVENFVDHHDTSKNLVYRARWYRYTPEQNIWDLEGHVHATSSADTGIDTAKSTELVEIQPRLAIKIQDSAGNLSYSMQNTCDNNKRQDGMSITPDI